MRKFTQKQKFGSGSWNNISTKSLADAMKPKFDMEAIERANAEFNKLPPCPPNLVLMLRSLFDQLMEHVEKSREDPQISQLSSLMGMHIEHFETKGEMLVRAAILKEQKIGFQIVELEKPTT